MKNGPDELEEGDGAATGADTLLSVLREASDAGYDGTLTARVAGDVDCGTCGTTVNTAALQVDVVRRLEGASDAADLMLVASVQCPVCGARGTLTLGYGPNASDADVAVLPFLDLNRARSGPADNPG